MKQKFVNLLKECNQEDIFTTIKNTNLKNISEAAFVAIEIPREELIEIRKFATVLNGSAFPIQPLPAILQIKNLIGLINKNRGIKFDDKVIEQFPDMFDNGILNGKNFVKKFPITSTNIRNYNAL